MLYNISYNIIKVCVVMWRISYFYKSNSNNLPDVTSIFTTGFQSVLEISTVNPSFSGVSLILKKDTASKKLSFTSISQ